VPSTFAHFFYNRQDLVLPSLTIEASSVSPRLLMHHTSAEPYVFVDDMAAHPPRAHSFFLDILLGLKK
jgi:hypothetical protein